MSSFDYILNECAWLYTKIYQNRIFFLDLWSFVHLWNGFMIYLLLRAARFQRPMTILVTLIFLWEITEILFVYFAFMIFKPEIIKDQFTDIFIGITGGIASYSFLFLIEKYHKSYKPVFTAIVMIIVSTSYAFYWVGFYGYHYNVECYNTPGLNISSFSGWTANGLFILILFRFLRKLYFPYRLMLTWLIFALCLLVGEYVYYYILEVRETSGYPLKPLIFGLIHGTRTLHIFYTIAPFTILGIYYFGIYLVNRAIKKEALSL